MLQKVRINRKLHKCSPQWSQQHNAIVLHVSKTLHKHIRLNAIHTENNYDVLCAACGSNI